MAIVRVAFVGLLKVPEVLAIGGATKEPVASLKSAI